MAGLCRAFISRCGRSGATLTPGSVQERAGATRRAEGGDVSASKSPACASLRRRRRARRRRPQHRPRPDPRHRRPERLGQDDALQRRHRRATSRPPAASPGRARTSPAGRRTRSRARAWCARFQQAMSFPGALGPRERADRLRARPGPSAARRDAAVARRPTSCWRFVGLEGDAETSWPARCPSATCDGWAWRSRSRRSLRSCSWTSRRRPQRQRDRAQLAELIVQLPGARHRRLPDRPRHGPDRLALPAAGRARFRHQDRRGPAGRGAERSQGVIEVYLGGEL